MSGSNSPKQSAGSPAAAGAPSSSAAGSNQRPHHEDLLGRTWRSIAQSVVQVTHKAETHAADPINRETSKELTEATILVLRSRMDWAKSIAYLEAKLEGKAEEMKVQQQYLRCHPKIGRKRKRIEEDTSSTAVTTEDTPRVETADETNINDASN